MVVVIALTFLLCLFLPSAAQAWGPAAHLEIAREVLQNTGLVSGAARGLIEAFPFDFLYGNIAADIVVAKNLVEELKHCHNWKVGFRLLKKAESDSQRSFAYGYLSHLAADTVAHNNFIPEMMISAFKSRAFKHVYWEMRFDMLVDKRVWQLPKQIVKSIHQDNDRLLDSIIEDTPLSFKTNKTIFSSILSLHRFKQWHRMLVILSTNSKWSIKPKDKERQMRCALEAAVDLLNNGQKAACVKKDPTGKKSIAAAEATRRRLNSLCKSGDDWESALEHAIEETRW